ncbi:hypothetical protein JCM19236_6300 [Vibrio sp. JCM 19236]|nr:hypothetical protein JCM19236_6300 [Vibrio sp. JCM 19236]
MREVQQAIYRELDNLYDEAKLYLEIWMGRIAEREVKRKNNKNNREFTNYSLSLEFNGNAFRIRWFRIQFVKNGEKTIRLAKAISVPKSHHYPPSSFSKADDWELDLITQIEEGVSVIRKKVNYLMRAHKNVIGASSLDDEPLIASSCKERVQVTTKSIAKIKESLY